MKKRTRSCYDEGMYLIQRKKCENGKYILSYGGGVNSSALFFYIIENKMPIDLVIFADTGEELDETYDCVNRMKQECEKRNIEFVVVKSKYGNLYDYYFEKKMVAGMLHRDCSSKFKLSPINNYLRTRFGKQEKFNMYIGIAFEEKQRMKISREQYKVNIYPFCDEKIDRKGCEEILLKNNFKAIKSGCKGCIFLKKRDWIEMAKNNPKEMERWIALDKNNKRYPRLSWCPSFKLEDIYKAVLEQKSLMGFDESPEPSCDVTGGCFL